MTAKQQLRTVVEDLSEHEAADTLAFITRRRDALGAGATGVKPPPGTSDRDPTAVE